MRFNTDVFRKAFAARDQEVFKVFQDQAIKVTDDSPLSDLTVSLAPQSGSVKDFDFDLSLSKEDMGGSSSQLAYSGQGRYKGQDFTFSGPIAEFKMYYSLGEKFNHDHNYNANVWNEQPFRLIINEGDLKVEGQSLSGDERSELVAMMTASLTKHKENIQDAKKDLIS